MITSQKICTISDCTTKAKARGWCNKHWYRWYRNNNPTKTTKNYEEHGLYKKDGYCSWKAIKQRVLNSNSKYYSYYGGRGITVCDGIKNSFRHFITTIGDRPDPSLTVDRTDNASGYWCGNCDDCISKQQPLNIRWATKSEQQHNSRRYEVVA